MWDSSFPGKGLPKLPRQILNSRRFVTLLTTMMVLMMTMRIMINDDGDDDDDARGGRGRAAK